MTALQRVASTRRTLGAAVSIRALLWAGAAGGGGGVGDNKPPLGFWVLKKI